MKRMREIGYGGKLTGLAIILVIIFFLSFFFGRYQISPSDFFQTIYYGIMSPDQIQDSNMLNIIVNVRLPRILMAPLVGCCLAAAGVSYQGIFQNPMASPDFLGASSGAALGAALAIILRMGSAGITLLAFVFGIGTVLLVMFVSSRAPGNRVSSLILAGVIISSLCSSGTSFIKLVADPNEQLPAITYWLMGSISDTRLPDVWHAAIPMAVGLVPLLLLRWRMNLLTLGDEEATSMGINVQKVRVVVILCSTLVTAAAVSFSGVIGWIGLVIPHFARRVVGNNYKRLFPATMLMGGIFLLVVDDVSRNLLQTEIPLGILTAIIGAPFFVYLITRKEEVL